MCSVCVAKSYQLHCLHVPAVGVITFHPLRMSMRVDDLTEHMCGVCFFFLAVSVSSPYASARRIRHNTLPVCMSMYDSCHSTKGRRIGTA